MNILTDIKIKGEVFANYAYLSCEFEFNSRDKALAEYNFRLPKKAVVSSAKIVTADKIINMTVIPMSHAAALFSGAEAAILRQIGDGSYSLKLGVKAKGQCRVVIRIYTSIDTELTLPIVCEGANAEVELLLSGINSVSSRTHKLFVEKTNHSIGVKSGRILADRDFNLCIEHSHRGNMAMAVQKSLGGEMLCRIRYDAGLSDRYKRLLMICDCSSLYGGALSAAKEFMCHTAEQWKGEFAAAVSEPESKLLMDYTQSSPGAIAELINQLGAMVGIKEVDFDKCIDKETLPIILCGTNTSYNAENLYAVSFGASARTDIKCKKREHIYGRDDMRFRAAEIISRFNSPEIKVVADASDIEVICAKEGFCDVYVRYMGNDMPKELAVNVNGVPIRALVEGGAIYKSSSMMSLALAYVLCNKLQKRLESCTPDEISGIRAEMERIGVEFSALNSETAFAAAVGNERPSPVRIVVPDKTLPDVFEGRYNIFRENDAVLTSAEYSAKCNECLEVIFCSIRSDGGIYVSGEVNPNMQKLQTAVCYLALLSAGALEKNLKLMEDAERFVSGFEHKFIHITQNIEESAEILKKFFGDADAVYSGIPDLLTAAKVIWRTGNKTNSIFC